MKQLSLFREIIVDNFAGGGGASTGIEMATGMSVDIAINHDPAAIAMHKANHPETEHYCESVWDVDPKEAVKGRKVGLAWFSPDCKHFSKAKGGKPVNKKVRGLAWIAVKWAIAVRPRVIMLENVEEFKTWGPLLENGKPDPKRKGETFQSFIKSLESLGYEVDWKEMRACDYGAPTIRKRLFLVARCDGKPIKWPEPTHADPKLLKVQAKKLKPWRTTAEIIDWSLPCPSIFDSSEKIKEEFGLNVVRPLSENTQKRIARGMQRFVIDNPNPFIVRIGQTGFGGDRLQYSLDQPLTTITTKAEHCLVVPFLTSYHSETQPNEVRGLEVTRPLHTLDTSNRFGLVTAHIMVNTSGHPGSSINEPLKTVTTGGHHALVTAFLVKYYGNDVGQSLNEPLHTITTNDRFGLVTVKGRPYQIVDIGFRMLQPHELYQAQGFPKAYIFDQDYENNPIKKKHQVAKCGNSVPPPFAEALVRANLPEMCASNSRYAVGV
ncbi:DNA cytosine methyltransferase [Lysinibacillus capsici]|uniref:DNA cytosine methyltransferase n=1 Tax=Lysinibacillus capsici TaxID=2115968 RepID=UPI002FDD67FC